jgi:hypothetical protein
MTDKNFERNRALAARSAHEFAEGKSTHIEVHYVPALEQARVNDIERHIVTYWTFTASNRPMRHKRLKVGECM